MIITPEKDKCCGCTACASICNKKAITLSPDEEGFLYPVVDEAKCVKCGLCEKICPFGDSYSYEPDKSAAFYASYDVFKRSGSSSGGLFYTLAEYVISEKHGWVFGAAFDDNLKLRHIGVNTIEGITPLRGSKYVQSDINATYERVKTLLGNGQYVLYVGTPCQIAGLRAYLRKKYENLVLVDVVCHGVPSQSIFDAHKEYLEKKYRSKVKRYQFRDNEKWGGCEIVDFENNEQVINASYNLSPYLFSFMQGLTCRESCYECPFAKMPRQGDITLGDFWGVKTFFPKIDTSKGVSLVIVNTTTGQTVWNEIKKSVVCLESNYVDASKENQNLVEKTKRPERRTGVYDRIKAEGYEKIARKEFRHPNYNRIWIRNEIRQSVLFSRLHNLVRWILGKEQEENELKSSLITIHTGFNFGSVLQTIATVKILSDIGIKTTVVNYIQPVYTYQEFLKGIFTSVKEFVLKVYKLPDLIINNHVYGSYLKKYCNVSAPIYRSDSFLKRCPVGDYYITGSDQVWNTYYNGIDMHYFFSGITGVKFSLSASIGKEKADEETKKMLLNGLKDYIAISVREETAVDILSELEYDSTWLIDPTFMLNKEDWALYETRKNIKKKYILLYLPYNIKDKDIIYKTARQIADKNNLEVVTFSWNYRDDKYADKTYKYCSPGDFVTLMMHAEYVITNSFHGTAFSINLNKQFWVYMPTSFSTRIESTLSLFNLEDRLLSAIITDEQISEKIDYNIINGLLEKERKRTWLFLLNIINNNFPQA